MSAIPFARHRFTPADMGTWDSIARPKISKGLWASWSRQSCSDHDEICVMLPSIPNPAFRFYRLRDGKYRLVVCDGLGWQVVAEDDTAEGCLFVWLRPKEFIASIAPGADRSIR